MERLRDYECRVLQNGLEVAKTFGGLHDSQEHAFYYANRYRAEGKVEIQSRFKKRIKGSRWSKWKIVAIMSKKAEEDGKIS